MVAFNRDHSVERELPPFSSSFIRIRSSVLRARSAAIAGDNRGSSRGKMIFRREYRALRKGKYLRDLISPRVIYKRGALKTFERKGTTARIALMR